MATHINGNGKKVVDLSGLLESLEQAMIELGAIKQAASDVKLTHAALSTYTKDSIKSHPKYNAILQSRQVAFDLAFNNLLELL